MGLETKLPVVLQTYSFQRCVLCQCQCSQELIHGKWQDFQLTVLVSVVLFLLFSGLSEVSIMGSVPPLDQKEKEAWLE